MADEKDESVISKAIIICIRSTKLTKVLDCVEQCEGIVKVLQICNYVTHYVRKGPTSCLIHYNTQNMRCFLLCLRLMNTALSINRRVSHTL